MGSAHDDGLYYAQETRRRRWARVNGDPLEYLIGRGRFGDEFVKLEDGTCVCRPVSEQNVEGTKS